MRRSPTLVAGAFVCMAVAACNQLFGIEEANPVAAPGVDEGGALDAAADVTATDAITARDADAGADVTVPERWLFAATTGLDAGVEASTEVTLVAISEGPSASVESRFTLNGGPARVYASGGRGFIVNRLDNVIHVLDRQNPGVQGKIAQIRLTSGTIPYAVEVLSDKQAYVIANGIDDILTVDLTAVVAGGQILVGSKISLGPFTATSPPGPARPAAAVLDRKRDRLWVALQRMGAPAGGFFPNCSGDKSIIVAIDTTTNKVVDFNGDGMITAADSIVLAGVSPTAMVLDEVNDRLIVTNFGCADAAQNVTGREIDEVPLNTRTSSKLLDPAVQPQSLLNANLYIDDKLAYAQMDTSWSRYNPTNRSLDPPGADLPFVSFIDKSGFIVGLRDSTSDGGAFGGGNWDVYRVNRNAQLGTKFLADVFKTVRPRAYFFVSAAPIR